ncbi:MAG TPA: metallophosphoesterase [Acidimicrobiales bacterium]|nr:metallophosphoesterase [Acidimicrobiales bacterium]
MTAVRVAAFGDVHVGADSVGRLSSSLADLGESADLLVVAGDLTRCGTVEEAAIFASELGSVNVPKLAVLGNHDYHGDQAAGITALLEGAGVVVLEGRGTVIDLHGATVGVAGVKGFGGGFTGASGSDFGEPEMKAFMRHSRAAADALAAALEGLEADVTIAVTHYSPVPDTLAGERLEIYPFLGSSYLAEAVDRGGAALALHGHAHNGTERGTTPGGVPVRNVAVPVIGAAYHVYALEVPDPALAR